MLKRINWKAIGKGFAWLLAFGGLVTLMSFIAVEKQTVKCSKIDIFIPGADNFIEREEIDIILQQSYGKLEGKELSTINTHRIEEDLKANPYIAFAKVYAEMDGVIHVMVRQRQPVVRIINASGQDFYIDREGLKMPMSPNFTANVVVATGNITEGFAGKVDTLITPMLNDLYKTALFIKRDTLWDAQIEQIFVNEKQDIELIPRVGNQRIILGNADSLEVKMSNLLAFYKQAMPQVGWDTYKTINLKYVNQVVCEKNIIDPNAKTPIAPVDSSMVVEVRSDVEESASPTPLANNTGKSAANTENKSAAEKKSTVEKKVTEEVKVLKPINKDVAKEKVSSTKVEQSAKVSSSAAEKKPVKQEAKAQTAAKLTAEVKTNPTLYQSPSKQLAESNKTEDAKKKEQKTEVDKDKQKKSTVKNK